MVEVDLSCDDLKFKREIRALVCGPSGIGKTTLVLNIIRNREKLFSGEPFKSIYWCVDKLSSIPDNLHKIIPEIQIVKNLDFLKSVPQDSLIIFDDVIFRLYASEEIADLAVRRSSHEKISFFILTQNLFVHIQFCILIK